MDREIFGARAFSAMKSGNMVLNPPPGLVFSTDARIEPFREVIIGGTGLEVSTGEAEVSLALCQSPNIVLTQHRWRKIEAPLRRMTDCSGKSHPASTRC